MKILTLLKAGWKLFGALGRGSRVDYNTAVLLKNGQVVGSAVGAIAVAFGFELGSDTVAAVGAGLAFLANAFATYASSDKVGLPTRILPAASPGNDEKPFDAALDRFLDVSRHG